jgi:hypothetical protein
MSTIKQKTALNRMVENGGNVSQAMRDVGYSYNTAKTPQKLTESLGFIELCEEKGLTDGLLINALIEDIKNKKGNRRAELELGFKIKGRLIQKINIDDKPLSIMFDNSFNKSII